MVAFGKEIVEGHEELGDLPGGLYVGSVQGFYAFALKFLQESAFGVLFAGLCWDCVGFVRSFL